MGVNIKQTLNQRPVIEGSFFCVCVIGQASLIWFESTSVYTAVAFCVGPLRAANYSVDLDYDKIKSAAVRYGWRRVQPRSCRLGIHYRLANDTIFCFKNICNVIWW